MPVPPQLYLDTSVIGGYFDAEFEQDTRELWRQRELGLWTFVTSGLVADELLKAPPKILTHFRQTFDPNMDLPFSPAMQELAVAYVAAGVLSENYFEDARHVALCTIYGVDHLVSWNFKHMVNVRRAAGFNEVNLLRGFAPVSIVSPKEIIHAYSAEKGL